MASHGGAGVGAAALVMTLGMVGAAPAYALSLGAQADLVQQGGSALEARLGLGLPTPGLHLSPELGLAWFRLEEDALLRGSVGGSLTVGTRLRPGVYAHVGLARELAAARFGPSWDAGLMLDVALLPLLRPGLRVGYAELPDRPGALTAGLSLAVGF